jgi:hypothetical protein
VAACGGGADASSTADPVADAATPPHDDAAAASTSTDGGMGGDASAPAGIEIVNLSYTRASLTTVNFVLANAAAAAIESLEGVEIQFEDEPLASSFDVDFAAAGFDSKTCRAWVLAPGASSTVIELPLRTVSLANSSGSFWMLDVPCSVDSYGVMQSARDLYPYPTTPAKPGGTVTLRLRGLLANGAPWSAKASGQERK